MFVWVADTVRAVVLAGDAFDAEVFCNVAVWSSRTALIFVRPIAVHAGVVGTADIDGRVPGCIGIIRTVVCVGTLNTFVVGGLIGHSR